MNSTDICSVLGPFLDNQTFAALSQSCSAMYKVSTKEMLDRLSHCTIRQALQSSCKHALTHMHHTGRLKNFPVMRIEPAIIEFLHTQYAVLFTSPLMEFAAEFGGLDMVMALHRTGLFAKARSCMLAARSGNLDVLAYFYNHGCPLHPSICLGAIDNGHIHILRYLESKRYVWDAMACSHAAGAGDVQALKYIHDTGGKWDGMTTSLAAQNGHLEALKYLHVNKCEWDSWTCAMAAYGGHLDVLQYAHEHGCPWDHTTRSTTNETIIAYLDTMQL